MCPHTAIYVSSYCCVCMCVLILHAHTTWMRQPAHGRLPHTAAARPPPACVCAWAGCRILLLHGRLPHAYVCAHTVCSYSYCMLILLYAAAGPRPPAAYCCTAASRMRMCSFCMLILILYAHTTVYCCTAVGRLRMCVLILYAHPHTVCSYYCMRQPAVQQRIQQRLWVLILLYAAAYASSYYYMRQPAVQQRIQQGANEALSH